MFRIERIPDEHRPKVLEILSFIEKAKTPVIKQEFIEFLFDIWNTHVYPDNQQNISCMNCRIYVIGQLRHYTKQWKKQK